jgi:Ribbon-helix-helix protein, copG family
MDLTPYVAKLRDELAIAAEAGGPEARALAERLTAPLDSAIRLTLLEALSAAAAEITRDLAPGSVELRLRGLDPGFVVTTWPSEAERAVRAPAQPEVQAPEIPEVPEGTGGTTRINLRLPDDLKARIDKAADREHVSVNAWLVRAAATALDTNRTPRGTGRSGADGGQRYTGWVR